LFEPKDFSFTASFQQNDKFTTKGDNDVATIQGSTSNVFDFSARKILKYMYIEV